MWFATSSGNASLVRLPTVTHRPSQSRISWLYAGHGTRTHGFVPDWAVPVAAAVSWVFVHVHTAPGSADTSANDAVVGNRRPPRLMPIVGRSTRPSTQAMLNMS